MRYYIKIALQHYAMGLVIPIAIIWKLQNGLSLPEAVLTESVVLLVTALTDLPAGYIANRIGNKRSLLIGGLLHLVGMGLLATGSSLTVFMAAAVSTGLAWAFISGADEAYIHDDFIEQNDEYKKVFATSSIVDECATVAGMLTASLSVYFNGNLRILFVTASIVLAVHYVYTHLLLPASRPLPPTHGKEGAKLLSQGILKGNALLAIIPVMLAFAIIYEAGRPLWQPHMAQIGIDIAAFGLIFALLKLASIGGSILARYRQFHPRELGLVFAVMLMSLLAFGVSVKVISLTALCLYLFTENYFRIYMSTVLNGLIEGNRAAILSIGSVIRNASGAILVAGAGLASNISILAALAVLVAIKVPAIIFVVIRSNKMKNASGRERISPT